VTAKRRPVPPVWIVKPAMRIRNALGRLHARVVPPEYLVMERMGGMVETKILSIIADLGIPDRLASGPRTAADLAGDVGADADALDRALAFLASRGLLGTSKEGRYENNWFSEVLRSDHPQSMRHWARFFGSDWHWDIWNQAGRSLATGEPGTVAAFGVPYFEYLNRTRPEAGETFNRALGGASAIAGPIVAKGFDFSGISRLCDVGGGTGGLLAEILARNTSMRGVLFDLPEVAEQARSTFEARGLSDRVEISGGSFFDRVPSGCDAYLMQAVIHDWDDDSCVKILTNVRDAMGPGGRVLVIESVLKPTPAPIDQFARTFDLVMLVITGAGRERTRAQFDSLFARAGLRVRRDVTLPTLFHVLELGAA
jgi:O-methyltransferase